MKKIRFLLLIALSLLLAVPAVAASGYQAELSALEKTYYVGDILAVSVDITQANGAGFAAADLTLSYDASCLEFVSVMPDGLRTDSSANGKIRFVDVGEDKKQGDGVYTVSFRILKAGQTTLSISSAAFSSAVDAETGDLSPATLGSALKLTVSGAEKPVAGDANGDGKVEIVDVLRLVKYALGLITIQDVKCDPDVNGNGTFNLLDIVHALRLAMEAYVK